MVVNQLVKNDAFAYIVPCKFMELSHVICPLFLILIVPELLLFQKATGAETSKSGRYPAGRFAKTAPRGKDP